MRKYLGEKFGLAIILCVITIGCSFSESADPDTGQIHTVLDDWHNAAAEADFDRYFNHFASDSAIFMGTDATKRWTITEFKAYAKPHFDEGEAWSFTSVERNIYFSGNEKTAWFDEALDTPNLGPARGMGVLVHQDGSWKIAHYNLSIPIPNAIADTVVKQVEEALSDSARK